MKCPDKAFSLKCHVSMSRLNSQQATAASSAYVPGDLMEAFCIRKHTQEVNDTVVHKFSISMTFLCSFVHLLI